MHSHLARHLCLSPLSAPTSSFSCLSAYLERRLTSALQDTLEKKREIFFSGSLSRPLPSRFLHRGLKVVFLILSK